MAWCRRTILPWTSQRRCDTPCHLQIENANHLVPMSNHSSRILKNNVGRHTHQGGSKSHDPNHLLLYSNLFDYVPTVGAGSLLYYSRSTVALERALSLSLYRTEREGVLL
jgi:hypothetical protein